MKAKLAPTTSQTETEAKKKAEEEVQAKAAAEAKTKAAEEAAAKRKAEAEAEAKQKAEAEAKEAAEGKALSGMLLGVGVKENKLQQVLGVLAGHGIDDADDLEQLDADDVNGLGLPLLQAKQVTKLLSQLKVASPSASAQEEEAKFAAPRLVLGPAGAAARGIQAFLGITPADMGFTQRALEVVEAEWAANGTPEDNENVRYVIHGIACDPQHIPPHMQAAIQAGKYHGGKLKREDFDTGHAGMRLQDFVDHVFSKLAGLTLGEAAAIRLYTTSSYRRFNQPLRDEVKPHPFKFTVCMLFEGIKKLRAVTAQMDPADFNKVKWLWRGVKDKSLDYATFKEIGGTEYAPMSTTEDKNVALAYAASACPLVFKYRTKGMGRGCSISFLSVFPGEKEFLYPPLTFLSVDTNTPEEKEGAVTIYTIEPQMP